MFNFHFHTFQPSAGQTKSNGFRLWTDVSNVKKMFRMLFLWVLTVQSNQHILHLDWCFHSFDNGSFRFFFETNNQNQYENTCKMLDEISTRKCIALALLHEKCFMVHSKKWHFEIYSRMHFAKTIVNKKKPKLNIKDHLSHLLKMRYRLSDAKSPLDIAMTL